MSDAVREIFRRVVFFLNKHGWLRKCKSRCVSIFVPFNIQQLFSCRGSVFGDPININKDIFNMSRVTFSTWWSCKPKQEATITLRGTGRERDALQFI